MIARRYRYVCGFCIAPLVGAAAHADPQVDGVRYDPFARPRAPLVDTAAPAARMPPALRLPDLQLKGVLSMGSMRLANIDDAVLAPGDTLYGYRIQAITNDAVTLVRGADSLTLTLEGATLPHDTDP